MAVFGYSLEGKPPYHGLVIGLLVSLALLWVGNSRYFRPQRDELAGMEARLVDLRGKIQQGRAAEQRLPQFRDEVERLELELEKLLRILPSKRNTPELLQGMRRLAEDEDFNLKLFRAKNEIDKEFYSEYPLDVELDGNYHSLARFFERIGNFPRIINIDDLKIKSLRDQNSFRTIQATFTAKTFVYKEYDPDTAGELEIQ